MARPVDLHAPVAARPHGATPFVLVEVVAQTSEAAEVRHAASACAGCGVVRCIPLHKGARVRLQIRCPACEVQHLMQEVASHATAAQFERTAPWAEHLDNYHLTRHS